MEKITRNHVMEMFRRLVWAMGLTEYNGKTNPKGLHIEYYAIGGGWRVSFGDGGHNFYSGNRYDTRTMYHMLGASLSALEHSNREQFNARIGEYFKRRNGADMLTRDGARRKLREIADGKALGEYGAACIMSAAPAGATDAYTELLRAARVPMTVQTATADVQRGYFLEHYSA